MSKLANKWIDLFRAGDYGEKGSFTQSDLDQVVTNYNAAAAANFQDPDQHEAPSTFGHPKGSAAAYGWWSKLQRVGDLLQGQMGKVQPEFEDAVDRELFKKRSVGLQQTAKGWTLHHVAWLGAQAPAIKGLANVSFEGENTTTEIDFSEETSMTEAERNALSESLWERIKSHFGAPRPADPGTKTFSEEDMKKFAADAVKEAVKPLETRLDEQATKFSEREKSLITSETKQRADAAIAQIKLKGAWVPAMDVLGLPLVFAELATATETVEFGEGDKKAKKTPLEIFTGFMESLGTIVPPGRKVEQQRGSPQRVAFTETPQTPADQNSVAFHEEITKLMDADSRLDYRTAMRKAADKFPHLTRPGISTAGQV